MIVEAKNEQGQEEDKDYAPAVRLVKETGHGGRISKLVTDNYSFWSVNHSFGEENQLTGRDSED